MSNYVQQKVDSTLYLELFVQRLYSLTCFRVMKYANGDAFESLEKQNEFNLELVETINKDGFMYLSKSINNQMQFIRFNVGSYETTKQDIDDGFKNIEKFYQILSSKYGKGEFRPKF